MKKLIPIVIIAVAAFCFGKVNGAEFKVGFVNFKTCIEKSKQGQQEKNSFESMKKEMSDTLEKTDKELEEIAKKLEDQDYMDGLSPAAEDELKQRFQGLSQKYASMQNQFYQLLNQANYKMLQSMHDEVSHAAEKVRDHNGLSLLFNEDSAFAYVSSLDFTHAVIEEMDKQFEKDNSQVAKK